MIIIHGDINQGKTTKIKEIISSLDSKNKTIGGCYTQKIIINNKVIGYDLVLISLKKTIPFLRVNGTIFHQKIGKYYINKAALLKGVQEIEKAILNNVDTLIIDEVGKLEINNNGWSKVLTTLFNSYKGNIILAIRTSFVAEIVEKWDLNNYELVSVKEKVLI